MKKPLFKGIGKGLKFLLTKDGGNTITNFAGSVMTDIKEIKTDPVKRWEGLFKLATKLAVPIGVMWLVYKGVITWEQAEPLLD